MLVQSIVGSKRLKSAAHLHVFGNHGCARMALDRPIVMTNGLPQASTTTECTVLATEPTDALTLTNGVARARYEPEVRFERERGLRHGGR